MKKLDWMPWEKKLEYDLRHNEALELYSQLSAVNAAKRAIELEMHVRACDLLAQAGCDPATHEFSVHDYAWDCPDSPIGVCVYGFRDGQPEEWCVFCHEPDERK